MIAALLFAEPALAQQQPDPAFLQRAISAMQQQRNAALDGQAAAEAARTGLVEEVIRLKARLSELEKPAEKHAK